MIMDPIIIISLFGFIFAPLILIIIILYILIRIYVRDRYFVILLDSKTRIIKVAKARLKRGSNYLVFKIKGYGKTAIPIEANLEYIDKNKHYWIYDIQRKKFIDPISQLQYKDILSDREYQSVLSTITDYFSSLKAIALLSPYKLVIIIMGLIILGLMIMLGLQILTPPAQPSPSPPITPLGG